MTQTETDVICPKTEDKEKPCERKADLFYNTDPDTCWLLLFLHGSSVRMIRMYRIFCWHRNRQALQNIYWVPTATEETCFRVYW